MDSFVEKIAHVKIVHDDNKKTEFSQFYGIQKFPVNFDLQVSVTFLNIIPNKDYRLKVNIISDASTSKIIYNDSQSFSVPEKDTIFLHNNVGQAFIITGIKFYIPQENAYKLTFILTDEKDVELSSFSNYYYFGGVDDEK